MLIPTITLAYRYPTPPYLPSHQNMEKGFRLHRFGIIYHTT